MQIEEIFEGRPGRKKYYTFTGGGITLGVHFGATLRSDWKEFELAEPATVDDFEGAGGIMALPGLSIGVYSLNLGIWINFKNPPCGMAGNPLLSPLDPFPVKVYLNTTGPGRDSGLGAGVFSDYFGWWEGREP